MIKSAVLAVVATTGSITFTVMAAGYASEILDGTHSALSPVWLVLTSTLAWSGIVTTLILTWHHLVEVEEWTKRRSRAKSN